MPWYWRNECPFRFQINIAQLISDLLPWAHCNSTLGVCSMKCSGVARIELLRRVDNLDSTIARKTSLVESLTSSTWTALTFVVVLNRTLCNKSLLCLNRSDSGLWQPTIICVNGSPRWRVHNAHYAFVNNAAWCPKLVCWTYYYRCHRRCDRSNRITSNSVNCYAFFSGHSNRPNRLDQSDQPHDAPIKLKKKNKKISMVAQNRYRYS